MLLDTSRYAKVTQEAVETRDGRRVTALKLRPLPPTVGAPYSVRDDDRLDLIAHTAYADDTRFWHIADANTALEARILTAETGAIILVPAS